VLRRYDPAAARAAASRIYPPAKRAYRPAPAVSTAPPPPQIVTLDWPPPPARPVVLGPWRESAVVQVERAALQTSNSPYQISNSP